MGDSASARGARASRGTRRDIARLRSRAAARPGD